MKGANVFIQLGASRDGTDTYLEAARRRGLDAWLVETPEYARCRRMLGRRDFDRTIEVESPSDPRAVARAIADAGDGVAMVLAGFEQYIEAAYFVARWLGVAPWQVRETSFYPLNKGGQRASVGGAAPWVRQPRHFILDPGVREAAWPGRPVVVKPLDSGGGWGVFLARTEVEFETALSAETRLLNYSGEHFRGVIVEDYLAGTEFSAQGICYDGRAHILTVCEKFILRERVDATDTLVGFREVGHLGLPGERAPEDLKRLVADCLRAVSYRDGPFHVDMIRTAEGLFFIEMGFRLSGGGLPELVRRVSGVNWGDGAFGWLLGREHARVDEGWRGRCHAQLVARSASELTAARELQALGNDIELTFDGPRPSPTLLSAAEATKLQADFSRHLGRAGLIRMAADDIESLRQLARDVFRAGTAAGDVSAAAAPADEELMSIGT